MVGNPAGRPLSADGCWLSAAGSRLPAFGCRLTAIGCRLLAFGSRLSASGFRIPSPGYRLSASGVPSAIPPRHCVALSPPDKQWGAREYIGARHSPLDRSGQGRSADFRLPADGSRFPNPDSPFPAVRK